MSKTVTIIVCGPGNSLTFVDQEGKRKLTTLRGAPQKAFWEVSDTLSVLDSKVTIGFQGGTDEAITPGMGLSLYLRGHRKPFYIGTVTRTAIRNYA